MRAPLDVPGVGRMAVIQEPAQATFGLWEARGLIGVGLEDEPGAPTWYELLTHDLEASERFYAGLFGWEATPRTIPTVGPYTNLRMGEQPGGGMMAIRKDWGEVPPHWQVYFAVEDCRDIAQRAEALKGCVIAGQEVPGVGELAVLADPWGAVFVIFKSSQGRHEPAPTAPRGRRRPAGRRNL